MFDIDVTEVGNPMILGCAKEEMENRVEFMLDVISKNHDGRISKDGFEYMMDRIGIDYQLLPTYLKRKIDDEVDIIEEEYW